MLKSLFASSQWLKRFETAAADARAAAQMSMGHVDPSEFLYLASKLDELAAIERAQISVGLAQIPSESNHVAH